MNATALEAFTDLLDLKEFGCSLQSKTNEKPVRKLSERSTLERSWHEMPLSSRNAFDALALYQVQLALSDEKCVASQVLLMRSSNPEVGYCGLLFELPSEYSSAESSSGDKMTFGFVYYENKEQYHRVELDRRTGKMRIKSAPPDSGDADNMNLGWRVLFQVDSITEYKNISS
eukprot:m.17210 g.17210  ORF g.17210 m.17210 type:complete len:173 (+) comp27379_c0_seq1:572-1090(+)